MERQGIRERLEDRAWLALPVSTLPLRLGFQRLIQTAALGGQEAAEVLEMAAAVVPDFQPALDLLREKEEAMLQAMAVLAMSAAAQVDLAWQTVVTAILK